MQFLYSDAKTIFMDLESFDQITLDIKVLDDNFIWLKGEICSVTF